MPARRNRYNQLGRPLPCKVVLPPDLAVFVYAAKRRLRFRDETELIISIVREWAADQEKPDWKKLVAELIEEDEQSGQDDLNEKVG